MKIVKPLLQILFITGVLFILALYFLKPQLKILTGYVAKNVCSCVFLAERPLEQIRTQDVGYGLLKYAKVKVDRENQLVTSSVLGIIKQTAKYRGELGCYLENKEAESYQLESAIRFPAENSQNAFPFGEGLPDTTLAISDSKLLEETLDEAFSYPSTSAVVVVKDNVLLAERYKEGFDENTIQLGWSMHKSITNALIGILVQQGRLDIQKSAPIAVWQKDDRKQITINDLLQMSSGLEFVEEYAKRSDVTKMLFEESAMGKYAINKPLEAEVGSKHYYSSGTSNILSEIVRQQFDSNEAYWNFSYQSLFAKINAPSFRLEADASGTFVGSSYAFATPRDWARFGLLYLNDGIWDGERILPEGWVEYTKTPAKHSEGDYGAHFWTNQGSKFPSAPKDMFWARGFDGQYVFILPSQNTVVVRLGVDGLGEMDADALLKGIVAAL
ncbi:MAG: serine hydrolase [Bacteroidota bacterium]